MKYKVGDWVYIKKNAHEIMHFNWNILMDQYLGKKGQIKKLNVDCIDIYDEHLDNTWSFLFDCIDKKRMLIEEILK